MTVSNSKTTKEQMELERILNRHGAESGELTEALITDLLAWHEQEVEKRVVEMTWQEAKEALSPDKEAERSISSGEEGK